MLVGGFLAGVVGLLWLTQIGVHTSYVLHVLPAEIVMSLGLGFAFVPMSSTALLDVDNHDAGVASATFNASQQVGGSLGTALLNTIYATSATAYVVAHAGTPGAVSAGMVHGYTVGFLFGAGALAAAAIAAAVLVSARRDQVGGTELALAG